MPYWFADLRTVIRWMFCCFLFVVSVKAQQPRTLTGGSYVETFNASRGALPLGWAVYKGATSTKQGESWTSITAGTWSGASNGVFSLVSGNSATESGSDYAIGVAPTSTNGDPGSSFQVVLYAGEAYQNYRLSFRLQSLRISSETQRSVLWKVQCQKGTQSWVDLPVGSSVMTTALSKERKNSLVTVDMGTLLDGYKGGFLIRVVALTASSGSGSRPLSAIDDFTLTYESNKQAQTVQFDPLPIKQLSEGTFTLSATASSGLPVAYSSSNTGVATVNGSTVTLKSVGETVITASQEGNNVYASATEVQQTLKVVNPVLSGVPLSIAFGSRLAGKNYAEKFVLASEYLKSDLLLTVEGEGFSVDPPLLSVAFEKQERTVEITFLPTHKGDYSGVLNLKSTDIDHSISLSGKAFSVEPPVVSSEEVTNHSFSVSWTPVSQVDEYRVAVSKIETIPEKKDQVLASTTYSSLNGWTKECHDDTKAQSWVLNNTIQFLNAPETDFSTSTNQSIVLQAATEGGNYTGNLIVVYLNGREIGQIKPTLPTFTPFVLPLSLTEKGVLSIRTPFAGNGVGAKIQSVIVKGDLPSTTYSVPVQGSPFSTQLTSFSLNNLEEKSRYAYEILAVQGEDVAVSSSREIEIKQNVQLVVESPTVELDEQIRNVHHLTIPANTGNENTVLRLAKSNQSINYLTLQAVPRKAVNELKTEIGSSLTIVKETCVEMDFSTMKNQWIFLSLPFDLNIVSGIKVVGSEGETVGKCEEDYALRVYDSERRALGYSTDNWWNVNQSGDPSRGVHTQLPRDTDILERGHGFIFFVPTESPDRIRFYAEGEVALTPRTTIQGVGYWQSGQEDNGGWQLLGNPSLTGENQCESFPHYVYHHQSLSNTYLAGETDYTRLSPLQSYFVQLPQGNNQLSFATLSSSRSVKSIVRVPDNRIVLTLCRGEQKWDETTVVFDDLASEHYVYDEDALIFNEGSPNRIGTLSGKYRLAINRLPQTQQDIPFFCSLASQETTSFYLKCLSQNPLIESVWLLDSTEKQLADLTQTGFPLSVGDSFYTLRVVPKSNSIATSLSGNLSFFFENGCLSANQELTDELTIYHLNGSLVGRGSLAKLSACFFPPGVYLLEYQQKSYRLVR